VDLTPFAKTTEYVNGLSLGPKGELVSAAGFREHVKVWSPAGKQLAHFADRRGYGSVCWEGALSSRGVVAAGFGNLELWFWNLKSKKGRAVAKLGGIIVSLAWSKNGKRLFAGNAGGNTVHLFDDAGKPLAVSARAKKSATTRVALTPDGKTGFSGGGDKQVHVWDAAKCVEIGAMAGHTGVIMALAISRDGSRVLSGSQDRTARVWDVKRGRAVCTLEGHRKQVAAVAWSPDGSRVATASNDRTVRVWDAESGEQLHAFRFGVVPSALAWGAVLYVGAGYDIFSVAH
jgi:WD40 repeat protein